MANQAIRNAIRGALLGSLLFARSTSAGGFHEAAEKAKPGRDVSAPKADEHYKSYSRSHTKRTSKCDSRRDRKAILKMTGTFAVSFSFEEVEAIAPGYVLRGPYLTSGIEVVSAITDEPTRVELQHVLLIQIGPDEYFPLKHWPQDWVFEDTSLLELQGNRIWRHRTLNERQVHCTWSQAVSQVDDGPRYESYGRWTHDRRQSSWTSGTTFRPLPRRESSQRSDYDVLLAVNTHLVDKVGWSHEEDNLKWVLESQSALVREYGFNEYRRVDLPAESVALEYLERTGRFWADVRSEWDSLLDESASVLVHEAIDGVAPYDILFPLAEELADADPESRRQVIHEILRPYVAPVDAPGGGSGPSPY